MFYQVMIGRVPGDIRITVSSQQGDQVIPVFVIESVAFFIIRGRNERCKVRGPRSGQGTACPPDVQGGNMSVPDVFFTCRLITDFFYRERYFNKSSVCHFVIPLFLISSREII